MSYSIRYKRWVYWQMTTLHPSHRRSIQERVRHLSKTPRSQGELLATNVYQVVIGHGELSDMGTIEEYRIVYSVHDTSPATPYILVINLETSHFGHNN